MRNFCGLSNDIKVRINSLSLEQKLEVEHTLNNWEWHNLLGDKPKGFDNLLFYGHNCYQECYLYKKIFHYITKYDYTHPLIMYINRFTTIWDRLQYHNVTVNNMSEEEFEMWYKVNFENGQGGLR